MKTIHFWKAYGISKNDIPFVSIGADHACEHLNKLMKVHAGLVGIFNNANARQRFFMVTPELSRVAKQFKSFSLTFKVTKPQNIMILGQVLSRRSTTL